MADIVCNTCSTKIGWKYVDAKEEAQRYKIGKYILETERVVTFSSWEDDVSSSVAAAAEREGSRRDEDGSYTGGSRRQGGAEGDNEDGNEAVEFDSSDEDECDDIFAGTWDAETVARRRRMMVAPMKRSRDERSS